MSQEKPLTYFAAVHEGQRLWKEIEPLLIDREVKGEILELKGNRLRWLSEYVKTTYGEKIYQEFHEEICPSIYEVVTDDYERLAAERLRRDQLGLAQHLDVDINQHDQDACPCQGSKPLALG
jgi:hypothetical protein